MYIIPIIKQKKIAKSFSLANPLRKIFFYCSILYLLARDCYSKAFRLLTPYLFDLCSSTCHPGFKRRFANFSQLRISLQDHSTQVALYFLSSEFL